MKCAACRVADGELELHPSKALCRRCADNVARFLLGAPEIILSAMWNREPAPPPSCSHEDPVFQEFKTRVHELVVGAHAYLDLAHAYAEMGLASDAISSAAHALSPAVPTRTAQRAVDLIFGVNARRDALDYVLRALRTSN